MYLLDTVPSRLVLLSPLGDITLLDGDLAFKSILQSEKQKQVLYRSYIFGRTTCNFLPQHAGSSSGAIIVLVLAAEEKLHLRVVSVGEDDAITKLGECSLPVKQDLKPSSITSMSCSKSGYLTILRTSHSHCPVLI